MKYWNPHHSAGQMHARRNEAKKKRGGIIEENVDKDNIQLKSLSQFLLPEHTFLFSRMHWNFPHN